MSTSKNLVFILKMVGREGFELSKANAREFTVLPV